MSNNFKYKKLVKFIHIAYIPRVKSQRSYFTTAYHWTIYSPKYGNTFRSVAGLWRNIRALPEGYIHIQVSHSVHFVDHDTQACTNHVENMWKNHHIKRAVERREVYYHRICILHWDNTFLRYYIEKSFALIKTFWLARSFWLAHSLSQSNSPHRK